MKKIILIIAALSFVLLLTSCASQNNTNGIIIGVHEGTDGLVMKFVDSMPPKEIWEKEPFLIGVELKNKGAYNITNARLAISGYDTAYFEFGEIHMMDPEKKWTKETSNLDIPNMEGKSMINPMGGYDLLTANVKNLKIDAPEKQEARFFVTACYGYQTTASPMICIDPYMNEPSKKNKICQVSNIALTSQGAPIVVKKVEPSVIPTIEGKLRMQFKIYIENAGTGEIRKIENQEGTYKFDCLDQAKSLEEEDINKILISAKISNKALTCQAQQQQVGEWVYYTLRSGEDNFVLCNIEVDKPTNEYTTPLVINLRYGYIQTIGTSMTVKKLPYSPSDTSKPEEPKTTTPTTGTCQAGHCKSTHLGGCTAYAGNTQGSCPEGSECCVNAVAKCEKMPGWYCQLAEGSGLSQERCSTMGTDSCISGYDYCPIGYFCIKGG